MTSANKSFTSRLNKAFIYPVSTIKGTLFLLIMGPIWAIAQVHIILQILAGMFVAAYCWETMFRAAMGEDRPDWPSVVHIQDFLAQFCRFFFASAVAFLPAILALIALEYLPATLGFILVGATGLFGVIYYPMCLLLIGFGGSIFSGLSYLFGIKSILRIPKDYFICVGYFVLIFFGVIWLETDVKNLLANQGMVMSVFLSILLSIIELYFFILQMYVTGTLYACNRDQLQWF